MNNIFHTNSFDLGILAYLKVQCKQTRSSAFDL